MTEFDAETIAALSEYLISQGLAESSRGYGHATGPEVAEGVAAFLTWWTANGCPND